MDSERTDLLTRAGVRVTRTATPFDPGELGRIAALVDERRGGVMSSGMEYPGRYSRWHMAYADPCAEIIATGRQVTARALNDRGRVLLPVLAAAMRRAGGPGYGGAGSPSPGGYGGAGSPPPGPVSAVRRSSPAVEVPATSKS